MHRCPSGISGEPPFFSEIDACGKSLRTFVKNSLSIEFEYMTTVYSVPVPPPAVAFVMLYPCFPAIIYITKLLLVLDRTRAIFYVVFIYKSSTKPTNNLQLQLQRRATRSCRSASPPTIVPRPSDRAPGAPPCCRLWWEYTNGEEPRMMKRVRSRVEGGQAFPKMLDLIAWPA